MTPDMVSAPRIHPFSAPGTRSARRIQLLQPDGPVRRLTAVCLRRFGFAVEDGDQAEATLAAAQTGRADLICVDLRVPGALDVCRALSAAGAAVPVLLVADHTARLAPAVALGFPDYVLAPFNTDDLVDGLANLARRATAV